MLRHFGAGIQLHHEDVSSMTRIPPSNLHGFHDAANAMTMGSMATSKLPEPTTVVVHQAEATACIVAHADYVARTIVDFVNVEPCDYPPCSGIPRQVVGRLLELPPR